MKSEWAVLFNEDVALYLLIITFVTVPLHAKTSSYITPYTVYETRQQQLTQ